MTQKERIEAVYKGDTPDQVPFMLDLSHWFYHKNKMPWDLSKSYEKPEYELIDYHKKIDAGFYCPNLGLFFKVNYPDEVKIIIEKSDDGKEITWRVETPIGSISRTRVWEDVTYAWGIKGWGIKTPEDIKILAYALENRTFEFLPGKYKCWVDYIGDIGLCYVIAGYSGMGQILNYWMGIEGTMYATMDWPGLIKETVERINNNNLELIKVLAASPAKIICMGDNFSSAIQPPSFYNRWSKDYYVKAIEILHNAGKYVAVHIDGMLAGAIEMIKASGADCGDAITPKPMGDLIAIECRKRAGKDFILSGGVSPDLWLPDVDIDVFEKAVIDWLELKKISPRLIANAGDQVPPGADEDRIKVMHDLVEKYGKY
jgi:hypothetical protein